MRLSKPIIIVVITVISIAGGFFLLLRGCLSKYDEHFAMAPLLYFEKDGKAVVFAIVQHQKATSYSQQGGFVRKSVSTNYFVQSNDAETGKKIADKKVKHQKQIKSHPVRLIGSANGHAWVFIGELMAFDPFSLDKKCDMSILEEKNPSLKGKLPAEIQYYDFNKEDQHIYFTATDGNKWMLNTGTLVVAPGEYDPEDSPVKTQLKKLEKEDMLLRHEMDTIYERLMRTPGKQYSAKEINIQEYQAKQKEYYSERTRILGLQDSIRKLKSTVEKQERYSEDRYRAIENLQRSSASYYSLRSNQDTFKGQWFGLYSNTELEKLQDRVQYGAANDETARRSLFTSTYSIPDLRDPIIDKNTISPVSSEKFLNGGFLLNRQNAEPVFLSNPAGFLVVHKDIIGNEGKILVSRIDLTGKLFWNFNTGLKEWKDWIFSDKRLIILGTDNKNLSGDESNVLLCIDLSNGNEKRYDYFKDR